VTRGAPDFRREAAFATAPRRCCLRCHLRHAAPLLFAAMPFDAIYFRAKMRICERMPPLPLSSGMAADMRERDAASVRDAMCENSACDESQRCATFARAYLISCAQHLM